MNKIIPIVSFVVGAAIGGTAAWLYARKKYEQLAQEEIDSIKKAFSNLKNRESSDDTEEENVDEDEEDSYLDVAKQYNYKDANEDAVLPRNIPSRHLAKPVVIAPEEFGEADGYEQISLTYFADKVLVDDNYDVIHNVEDIVGYDSLTHFGEYEDDSVFVRNDRLKCEYEILLDQRTYAEFLEEHPYKAEV